MAEKTPGIQNTLVRYNNPKLIKKSDKKVKIKIFRKNTKFKQFFFQRTPKSSKDGVTKSVAIGDSCKETDDILNSILPPRCWEENGKLWCQTFSNTPATRQDVINLQEMLDARLHQSQAIETGICPIRKELFGQCFGNFQIDLLLFQNLIF